MGYPMSWRRVRSRNETQLTRGYNDGNLCGDLLRFENNVRNPDQCQYYAREADTDPATVRRVLDAVLFHHALQAPIPGGQPPTTTPQEPNT